MCAALPSAAAPDAADTLVVNGKSAAADIRTIGGSPYVKLADVAKALGIIVTKRRIKMTTSWRAEWAL